MFRSSSLLPAFFSPSKLNLFFLIIDKRPDGYHQISSLLQAIDLGDTLHIDLAADDEMRCSDARLPTDRRNLVIKARDLFRAKLAEKREKSDFCAHIFLDKKVPMEAGLGGGSSNAATTLWALNHLLKSPFTDDELAQMGSEIGSDIPFFFSSGSALCSGRGEIVRPPGFIVPKEQVTIVKPDFAQFNFKDHL